MLEGLIKFPLPGIADIIDILIVAITLYWVMLLVKGTRAEKMLWGLGVVVIVYFISGRFELLTLHWILGNFLGSIVIILIVVFQQDIRRALVQMGRIITSRKTFVKESIEEISQTVKEMSEKKIGGLVVIERVVDLRDIVSSGIEMDTEVSKELMLTIFNPSTPLHDGALIIRNGRITRAGCILPLTEKELPKSMGTRHRAAVGLSEETDAVIVAVSEETGDITLTVDDSIVQNVQPDELYSKLKDVISAGTNRWSFLTKGFRS